MLNLVKTFSATKPKDRDALGDRVTEWCRKNPGIEVLDKAVRQSSDCEFHCMSIILLCQEGG